MLKYKTREEICEKNTNCTSWKKVKALLKNDEVFQKMSEYWPFGPKEESFREYEKLKFIQKNLEGITNDQVDDYSVALGKVLKWIRLAVECRIEDVKVRRKH